MRRILMAMVAVTVVAIAGVAMAADSTTVLVSANVQGTCKFNVGGTIPFGNLDPSVGSNVTATVSQPTFWCTKGSSYTITDAGGLNDSGGTHYMKHTTLPDTIPYSFTFTTTGLGNGKNSPVTMNISSTVLGANYINASVGTYADTVTLTIAP